MRWCCAIFEDFVLSAGKAGTSVVPIVRDNGRVVFFLQSRGVAADVMNFESDVPVIRASQQAIGFCPGCGEPLHDYYGAIIDDVRRDEFLIE